MYGNFLHQGWGPGASNMWSNLSFEVALRWQPVQIVAIRSSFFIYFLGSWPAVLVKGYVWAWNEECLSTTLAEKSRQITAKIMKSVKHHVLYRWKVALTKMLRCSWFLLAQQSKINKRFSSQLLLPNFARQFHETRKGVEVKIEWKLCGTKTVSKFEN
jgi:hypothetical protein